MLKSSTIAILLAALTAPAYGKLADEVGFSGEVNFVTGYFRESNNLSTESNSVQDSITQKPSSNYQGHDDAKGNGVFGLLGNLNYTFGKELEQQLFIGTSRDDIATGSLAFEVGYRRQFDNGSIMSMSMLPTLISTEVWEDPYAVNQERQKTDLTGNVGRFKLDRIMGTTIGIDVAVGRSEVDNDRAGYDAYMGNEDVLSYDGDALTKQEYDQLRRDRSYYSFEANALYELPNSYGVIKPSIKAVISDADGDAQSYESYKAEVSYAKIFGRHGLALTVDGRIRDYDELNPLYGTTREDKQYGVFVAYEYDDIFDSTDWSFVSLAGAEVIDSNIDYYDSDFLFFSVGVNYKF